MAKKCSKEPRFRAFYVWKLLETFSRFSEGSISSLNIFVNENLQKTDHAKTVDVMFFSFKAMPGGKERGRNESPRLLVTQPFKVHIAAKTKIILRESINQMMDIAFSHTLHASIMISYFVKM